ncbi:hypothetical protein NST21_15205 [Peribacillus sp. FSL K6-1552]|uniref:hypothetical protein n=1 Tax=Peribacillus sp. FSL K6-1552 TaxID=2954514 RepID=UPI0030FA6159
MKKLIGSVVVAVSIAGVTSSVFAEEPFEYNPTVRNVDTVEYIDGEEVQVNGIELTVDEHPDSSVGVNAAGKRSAKIEAKKPFLSNWYAKSSSTATYQQNTIGATARAFKGNGTQLGNTATSSISHSTIATAITYPGNEIGPTAYAIGNHTFKRSGYVDWYPQTKQSF